MATEPLRALLERAFPEAAELDVIDRTGSGDHFQVVVASARFDGLTLVDQHRLVYDALAAKLADGTIHELRIRTRASLAMPTSGRALHARGRLQRPVDTPTDSDHA
jgi:stress-induced morphogen